MKPVYQRESTMKKILQTCIAIEERVGEIYQHLVKHPDANDELREITNRSRNLGPKAIAATNG